MSRRKDGLADLDKMGTTQLSDVIDFTKVITKYGADAEKIAKEKFLDKGKDLKNYTYNERQGSLEFVDVDKAIKILEKYEKEKGVDGLVVKAPVSFTELSKRGLNETMLNELGIETRRKESTNIMTAIMTSDTKMTKREVEKATNLIFGFDNKDDFGIGM